MWLASGQSNMDHPVGGWNIIPNSAVDNYKEEILDTDFPQIRLLRVPKFPSPVEVVDLKRGEWQVAGKESVANFSAIGWFFAKKLISDLNVPIGVIDASWGGTPIRSWLDRESLKHFKDSVKIIPVPKNFNKEEWNKIAVSSFENNWIQRLKISYSSNELTKMITDSSFNDSYWDEISLPIKRNEKIVWLRKRIIIPQKDSDQSLQLSLGFFNRQSHVFINGIELGYFQYPQPLKTEIPPDLIKPGENLLTVRLAQPFGDVQVFGDETQFYITNPKGSFHINLNNGWKISSNLEPVGKPEKSYQNESAFLFNGMIAPLIPFGIKGFIWYQGESDAGRPFLYEKMFKRLITDWRQHWQSGNLPFLFFQISNTELSHHFETFDDSRCLIRIAQQKALALPNTGMVVCLDIGDPYDVHAKNKKVFGERLALQAEEKVYGRKVVSDGPVAKSFRIENDQIIVTFKTETSLTLDSYNGFNGFEVAGADHRFFPAVIKIKNKQIFLSSPTVKNPVNARYAWRNNPKCTLYNSAGLPAAPFSTKFLTNRNK